ncbi:hypothetical protein ACI8AF_14410 [Blastococcus sp. SYSU D00669]
MPASAKNVKKTLTSKLGFQASHTDHEVFEYEHDGKVVAVTKISHQAPGKDIGDKLLGMMARQCHVSGPVFRGAIACTVNRESFVAEMLSGL